LSVAASFMYRNNLTHHHTVWCRVTYFLYFLWQIYLEKLA
jgi:hypothetical protein